MNGRRGMMDNAGSTVKSRIRQRCGIRLIILTMTLAVLFAGIALGAVYNWTGAVSGDLNVDGNWAGGSQPAGIGQDQPSTPSIDDSLVFDSATWTQKPRRLYTRTNRKWGTIILKNGTIDWANDSNNSGNYSWSGTNTMIVGDGDATSANAQFNVINWNQGGTTGTKTYIIYSDGTLSSNRGFVNNWSNGADYDTVMRLIGGHVSINGELNESQLSDPGDYVIFEDAGSTFTFTKGTAAGRFQTLADLEAQMGEDSSFRPAAGFVIAAEDNGTTFTITSYVYIPAGTVLIIR